jgi:hypothetical protein
MSLMEDSQTLTDAKVTHLSTWMIVMDLSEGKIEALKPFINEALPITLRICHGEEEKPFSCWTNMKISDFLEEMSKRSGLPVEK